MNKKYNHPTSTEKERAQYQRKPKSNRSVWESKKKTRRSCVTNARRLLPLRAVIRQWSRLCLPSGESHHGFNNTTATDTGLLEELRLYLNCKWEDEVTCIPFNLCGSDSTWRGGNPMYRRRRQQRRSVLQAPINRTVVVWVQVHGNSLRYALQLAFVLNIIRFVLEKLQLN